MSDIHTHNLLFDTPIRNDRPIVLDNENVIQSLDSVYNRKKTEKFFQLYMGLLLLQYITIFCLVPFDGIDNRPPIAVCSALYSLAMVCFSLLAISRGPSC